MKRTLFSGLASIVLGLLVMASMAFAGNAHHVTTSGTAGGSGSIGSPWDLQTGLTSTSVQPGDTVYIHAGTYLNASGNWVTTRSGTSSLPVIYRAWPGDRAILSTSAGWSAPFVFGSYPSNGGSYVWLWNMELISDQSYPLNQPQFGANIGSDGSGNVSGDGAKVINCIIHDCVGGGIGSWWSGRTQELNGNLIYYNGRMEGYSNDAHDYGIYADNSAGTGRKLIKDNIISTNWSYGIHAYSQAGGVNNITLDGDVFLNAGYLWLGSHQFQANLLLGG